MTLALRYHAVPIVHITDGYVSYLVRDTLHDQRICVVTHYTPASRWGGGWRCTPLVPHRRRSHKNHPTADTALRAWCSGAQRKAILVALTTAYVEL